MSNGKVRTFVAAEVPPAVKRQIERAIEPMRGTRRQGVRWTSPDSWHLTLKFLGEIDEERIEDVAAATREVAGRALPFDVALGGWGAFPRADAPRVLWVGMEDGGDHFVTAAEELDSLLAERGFPKEKRPVRPHLTIARVKDISSGAEAFRGLTRRTLGSQPFVADKLIVFRSILDPGGARYYHLVECAPSG